MLRCLILFRSAAMSSSQLIVLRSRRLATIRTYGRMRELTRVDSSSTNPSRFNVNGSPIAGDVSINGISSTAVVSAAVASTVVASSAQGASTVSWPDSSRGVAGAVAQGADWPAFKRAAVLSFFLFALPCAV